MHLLEKKGMNIEERLIEKRKGIRRRGRGQQEGEWELWIQPKYIYV
jgi:hypothetical protein